MKTPISYYGGKQTMLKHLLPLVPEHRIYTEAFGGGLALYFAKEPAELEIVNDLNGNLINFFRVLKTRFQELKSKIDATLHSREEFDFAQIVYHHPTFFDVATRAWALWVCSKMGFASKLEATWGYDKSKNTMSKKLANAAAAFTQELSDRLRRTQIECTDALRIIQSRDSEACFHFVDPPYVGTNLGHYSGYNEMDFINLLEVLATLKGKFMLTMFPNEILSEFIARHGWHVKEVERCISASKTRRRKQTELIVCNYDLNSI